MHPPKPKLRPAIITALAAILLLAISAFLHARIPPQWLRTTPTSVSLGYLPYLAPPNNTVTYLEAGATFTPRGLGVATHTDVLILFDDRQHPDIPAGKNVYETREEALQNLKLDYPAACDQAGYPEAAALFDAAALRAPQAAGNFKHANTATLNHPERRPAAVFMVVRPYMVIAAWIALSLALPFIAIAAVRAIAARRANANRCNACGYDLSGTAETACCPECGLDILVDRDARRRRAGRTRRIAGWSLLAASLLLCGVWAFSFYNPAPQTVLLSHTAKDQLTGYSAALAHGGFHLNVTDFTPYIGSFSGAPANVLFADPEPMQIDFEGDGAWQIWYSRNYGAYHEHWLALWPLAATGAAAGLCLISFGAAARRLAHDPPQAAAPPKSFRRIYARFVLHWLALAALLTLAAFTPALIPNTMTWVDDFARNNKGVLFVSSDYANTGAEAKTTFTTRAAPVLVITTTTVTWFPAQPNVDEIATACQVNSRSRNNIPVRAPSLLFLPPGARTDYAPQPGLIITALCALLLVHPARELIAARKRRRTL